MWQANIGKKFNDGNEFEHLFIDNFSVIQFKSKDTEEATIRIFMYYFLDYDVQIPRLISFGDWDMYLQVNRYLLSEIPDEIIRC